jgi:cytochrome c oxidase subunit 4
MSEHVVPVRTYIGVFVALLVLTAATVVAARLDLGAFNTPVALLIAVVKSMLVILFFMHVKYTGRLVQLTVAAGFFWLFHLMAGTVADYVARGRVNPQVRGDAALTLEDR